MDGSAQFGSDRMVARKDGSTGWMLFNNPARRNAVTLDMWEAIPRILAEFEADDEIGCIVLGGAGGKTFVSGADISEFAEKRSSPETMSRYNATAQRASDALASCRKPTVAMIQGWCIGGGVAIALCCDMRIAADNARFGVPASRLGIGYAYDGVARLTDLVGPSAAKEIFYTARHFTAAEAYEMGLVNRVRSEADLERFVRDYAETIAANAPLTIAAVKLCVNEHLKDPDQRDLAGCKAAVDACSVSADYTEGRTAFMEKRQPVFRGR